MTSASTMATWKDHDNEGQPLGANHPGLLPVVLCSCALALFLCSLRWQKLVRVDNLGSNGQQRAPGGLL